MPMLKALFDVMAVCHKCLVEKGNFKVDKMLLVFPEKIQKGIIV